MRLVLSLLLMAFISMSFTSEVHALMLEKKTIKPSATSELKIVQPSTTAAEYALKLAVGKRYVWGGNSDTDVDCSSFAQQFMRGYKGIQISRTTYDQVKEGTKVNDKEAIKWLEKSVEVNDDMGQWLLGTLYLEGNENGIEIEKDTKYGLELLQKSAKQGNEKAKEELKKLK